MRFIEDHKDFLTTILLSGGGVSLTLTNIDLMLKVAIGVFTLVYVVVKLIKELNK